MRIAVAYDCLFPLTTGGGERQYREFAEALVARGHEVTYLTARQWDGDAPRAPFAVVPITRRLELYDEAGVRRPATALTFALALGRHLITHRRDYDAVIISALPVLNVLVSRKALFGARVTQVYDYLEVWPRHQWIAYTGRPVGTIAWLLQRLAIAWTPLATCHSRLSAARLRAEGLASDPIVSPGLISQTEPVDFVPEPDAPPYVVYAGRHVQDKRVDAIPAAVAYARREIGDLRAVILGKGPEQAVVEAAIAAEGIGDVIDLPGFVDEDALHQLIGHAAALVNPSRREGYGLVVAEAAGYGTPVVLVDDPGNAATELIDEGTNGFVAASTSAEDLGAAIVAAVRGGAELRRTTRAWYADALETRTIGATIDQILARLHSAAIGRRG